MKLQSSSSRTALKQPWEEQGPVDLNAGAATRCNSGGVHLYDEPVAGIPRSPTAVGVHLKLEAGVKLELLDKKCITDILSRKWRKALTAHEYMVLSYIVDRTTASGGMSFTSPVSYIINGNDEYAGVGVSRATFYRAVREMEKAGIITKEAVASKGGQPTSTRITINVDWMEDAMAPTLPVPKKLKNKTKDRTADETANPSFDLSHHETPPSHHETPLSHHETQYKGTIYKGTIYKGKISDPPADADVTQSIFSPEREEEGDNSRAMSKDATPEGVALQPVADPVSSLQAKIAAATDAQREKRRQKAERGMTTAKAKYEDIEAIWVRAVQETFPGELQQHLAWTQNQKHQIADKIKKWNSPVTFGVLVDWSVRNWPLIISRDFGWMTDPNKITPPTFPALWFFLKFADRFFEAKQKAGKQRFINDHEQSEYDRLIMRGRSPEEAMLETAKAQTVRNMRDEMTKREAKAARMLREAKRREEQADKTQDFVEKYADHPDFVPADPRLKNGFGKARIRHPNSPNAVKERKEQERQERERRQAEPPQAVAPSTDMPLPPPPPVASMMKDIKVVILPDWETHQKEKRARLLAAQGIKPEEKE